MNEIIQENSFIFLSFLVKECKELYKIRNFDFHSSQVHSISPTEEMKFKNKEKKNL